MINIRLFPKAIQMLHAFFSILAAYLFGSFCSAIIISRLFHLPDPRTEGSKNPGATNVLRLSGKKYALLVLIADALKGALPLIIGHAFDISPILLGWMGFAAVIGHIYPLYFNFHGGKGVATALGVILGFSPAAAVCSVIIWAISAKCSNISSLSALIAALCMPVFIFLISKDPIVSIPFVLISLMIYYQHRENIKRLWAGTEPRIGK